MAEPFVSHDGSDNNGVRAEVYVQTGSGVVSELAENGNNVKVSITNDLLKYPMGGWTSKSDPIYPILVEAKEQGREISYRIESQRKKGIDRAIPIAELRKTMETAKDNCLNVFAGIDGHLSSEAVTDPSEDPQPGGRISAAATNKQPAPSAAQATDSTVTAEQALAGLSNARKAGMTPGVLDALAALALAAGATPEQVCTTGVEQADQPAPAEVRSAFAKEAAPYTLYNTDGRLNLGSYAVQAAVGAEMLAYELISENHATIAAAHNAAVAAGDAEGEPVEAAPVNPQNAAALGRVLLHLSDMVQVAVAGGGRPNRQANSHTRARAYVYETIKRVAAVPFGQPTEAHEQWKQFVVTEAATRYKGAVKYALDVADVAPQAPAEPQQEASAPVEPQATAPAAADDLGARVPARASEPETPAAEITPQQTAQQAPDRLHEGDEGFTAPSSEVLSRLGALAQAAGFEPKPGSPVSAYLHAKFGVTSARKVHEDYLTTLVNWYEQKGEQAPDMFRQHVLAEAEAHPLPASA